MAQTITQTQTQTQTEMSTIHVGTTMHHNGYDFTAIALAAKYGKVSEYRGLDKRKKQVDGETYHLVTHQRGKTLECDKNKKRCYAPFGEYYTHKQLVDMASVNLYSMVIDKIEPALKRCVPTDIIEYILGFVGYKDTEIKILNEDLYFSVFRQTSIYRSAIFDNKGTMVSMAPPKFMHHDAFIQMYKSDEENIKFYEMIEGTMVNAFYHNNKWHLSTKHHLDGMSDCENYNIVCFKDACRFLGINFDKLTPQFCYSFILQHPDILYANECKTPSIYLVALYYINPNNNAPNNNAVIELDLDAFTTKRSVYDMRYKVNDAIRIPCELRVNFFGELHYIVEEWTGNLPAEIWENDPYEGKYFMHHSGEKGIIMHHKPSGVRTKVLNGNYTYYLNMRKMEKDQL